MMTADQLARMFQALPEPEPVVLKLYYNEQGEPIVYSSDKLDGNYIEVDAETFAVASYRVRVVNGELKHIPPAVYVNKLHPDDSGTLCHSQDVAVVVKDTGTHWKRKTYESN
jgi:hypothetical protein